MKLTLSRFASHGSKKLRFTYTERNAHLAQLKPSERYPLLQAQAPVRSIGEISSQFSQIEHTPSSQPLESPKLEIRGRVRGFRRAGKALMFVDIEDNHGDDKLQVVINKSLVPDTLINDLIRKGDSIAITGRPWRTKAGELSLLADAPPRLLSACLHPLPDARTAGDAGSTLRQHNRVAELKAFSEARQILRARDAIIAEITNLLRARGFIQVSTPVLSDQIGGATAKPFKVEKELSLRVAPELWLKRLVVGGLDRVFEIGPSFRNEGIDATHNPEFTTCEFYMAFANLQNLMELTQDIFKATAQAVAERFPEYTSNCEIILNNPHFRVLDFIPTLESSLNGPLSRDLNGLKAQCSDHGLIIPDDCNTIDDVLDHMSGFFLEPQCKSPTFIIHQPDVMAPLAKSWIRDGWQLSRRFELLIQGREYVNAYEEENDPNSQLAKLTAQDARVPDRAFVEALEWGLPPTGGWGLGIDRLVMLLTGAKRIGQVLTFGGLNQVNRQ